MSAEALQLPGIGETVGDGRFDLLRELGEGGTSTVFVAVDRLLGREVALKLLMPRYVGRPEREQRLINEAVYLRRVQGHSNVVELIDSGRLRDRDGWPWLSTEILAGEDLRWMFTRGKVETPQILNIARQTAVALARCHEAGVVHRDVTPSNLFLLEDNHTIKLFDFSHAGDLHAPKVPRGDPERLTTIFETMGTAGYMGPEQAMNAPPEVSMDAFSFGIVLFQLVTGRDPYRQFTDRGAFIKAQREGTLEPVRLHAWVYDAPAELADLVHDCTQRDGTKRPTMNDIIARLDAIGASLDLEVVASEPATKSEATEEVTAAVDVVALHGGQPEAPEPEPEVTVPVDAPTLVEPRRAAAPEVIGDWTVAQARDRGPASAAVAPPTVAPVPVVLPSDVASQPAATLAPPPAPSEERTVELAFARPPQLRPSQPPEPAIVNGTPSQPDLRPSDGEPSQDPEPEPTDDPTEPAPAEPAPIGPSRGRVVSFVAGLGLIGALLSWAAYSTFVAPQHAAEDVDSDRGQSSASPHDLDTPSNSHGELTEAETGADDLDAESETGGTEVVPEVEPVEPKPKKHTPKKATPKKATPKKATPKDPTCEGVEVDTRAANKSRNWNTVAKLTARKACWSSQAERIRLRVNALSILGRVNECIEVGKGSSDPKVKSVVRLCEAVANNAKAKSP